MPALAKCILNIDDIVIYIWKQHCYHIDAVLDRLAEAGIMVNCKKINADGAKPP